MLQITQEYIQQQQSFINLVNIIIGLVLISALCYGFYKLPTANWYETSIIRPSIIFIIIVGAIGLYLLNAVKITDSVYQNNKFNGQITMTSKNTSYFTISGLDKADLPNGIKLDLSQNVADQIINQSPQKDQLKYHTNDKGQPVIDQTILKNKE